MDPITTTIVAALPALASDLVKSSVKDAYSGLKSVIRLKWGATSAVAKSVEAMEANPKSKRQATVLARNVAATKAAADAEVMKALAKLVHALRKEGIGGKTVAAVSVEITGGSIQGVVGAKNVSVESMSFGPTGGRAKTRP